MAIHISAMLLPRLPERAQQSSDMSFKSESKRPQDAFKRPQDAFKRPQDAFKGSQDASGTPRDLQKYRSFFGFLYISRNV